MAGIVPDNSLTDKIEKLQQEFIELNKLFELNRVLNYASDIDSLGEKLIEFLKILMNVNNLAFFAKDIFKYKLVSSYNISSPYNMEFENQDEGIWQIMKTGQPFYITDETGRNIYSQFFENYGLTGLKSSIWLPFIHDKQVHAVLSIGLSTPLSTADFNFLYKVAEIISPAIYKFYMQKIKEANISELQKTLHNISILYNVGQAMNFIDDLKKLLKIILEKAIKTIGAQKGSLMLYDSTQNDLVVRVVHGLPDKETEEKINEGIIECTRIRVGEGIAGEVFASKKAIITNLGADDPRFKQADASRVSSIMCIPLVVKGENIGVINITNKLDGKFFNQDDLDFMGALASQAAIAINNAQLYELATRDGLTKLFIFRHFQFLLDNELKRSARYKHNVTLLMMDIDNFKNINDTYGHQIGDEILKHIANVITSTCRKIDMPARYGGEEFTIILPETNKENALKIAERLRQRIEDITVYTKENQKVSPTISIGIACFPEHANNYDNLVGAADKAMYYAKNSGKNCVAEYTTDGCNVVSCSINRRPE